MPQTFLRMNISSQVWNMAIVFAILFSAGDLSLPVDIVPELMAACHLPAIIFYPTPLI
jgi:hypothetical protein